MLLHDVESEVTILVFLAALVQLLSEAYKMDMFKELQSLFFWQL